MRIASEERGSGFPLLLVMGLGYGRWGWDPLIEPLAEHYRVIWFDNRGIGGSDRPEGPYSVAAMAEDALQVLDEHGVDRAHVVGASLGGMIAQEVALAAPDRVEKLGLLCTTTGGEGAYPPPAAAVELFAAFPTLPPEVALRRAVENAISARGELVERLVDLRRANPPDLAGWQAQLAAGMTFDAFDRVASIEKPTLVLVGDEDNVIDWRNSQVVAQRIADAELQIFPGTGHLFFWEQPDEVAATLMGFLR